MRQKAHLSTWVLAEMGQIDRRRRRRGCAQTSAVYSLHRGLDKPFSIDGGILWKTMQIYGKFELFRAGGSTWNYGGILFLEPYSHATFPECHLHVPAMVAPGAAKVKFFASSPSIEAGPTTREF